MTKTAFISGHLDLTESEFAERYKPLIDQAIEDECDFVVGDARGADAMAQRYLHAYFKMPPYRVTVYHMFTSPRNNWGDHATKGGYESNNAKDRAMTEASDFDILWVRPSKHSSESGRVSGTEKNQIRRKAMERQK